MNTQTKITVISYTSKSGSVMVYNDLIADATIKSERVVYADADSIDSIYVSDSEIICF